MLSEGTFVQSSAASNVAVPFSECSREEAVAFLSVIYSLEPHKQIFEGSAMSVARLGDKYGMKVHAQWSLPTSPHWDDHVADT